jgi:hypothetical protein
VVIGGPLAELKRRAGKRVAAHDPWDEREYEMYPRELKSPYRERRSAFGHERYSKLGVAREDWEARQRATSANWQCFGAPVALFCYIDRDLGPPQWSDVGMYLQTVMLLMRAGGLHSCPRWRGRCIARPSRTSCHHPTGSSSSVACRSGTRNATVPYTRTGRAPLDETVTFVEG